MGALQSPSPGAQAEVVRATQAGQFDPSYAQNLATFGGGKFVRPGGALQFNPTSRDPWGFGRGLGMPTSLLEQAFRRANFSNLPTFTNQTSTLPIAPTTPATGSSSGGGGGSAASFWSNALYGPWANVFRNSAPLTSFPSSQVSLQ